MYGCAPRARERQGSRGDVAGAALAPGPARVALMPLPPLIAIEIPRMDGQSLHVDDAAGLAQVFFATEVSSLGAGSYDARTVTTHPLRAQGRDRHQDPRPRRRQAARRRLRAHRREAHLLP